MSDAPVASISGESADAGWTDWRGPDRRSTSPFVPVKLPATPTFLWRVKLNSQSLGGVAANDRIVIVSDRAAAAANDLWRCFDAATGKQLWQFSHHAPAPVSGHKWDPNYTTAPRATPVISGDDVFLLGAFGDLHCVALRDGAAKWSHNLLLKFHGELPTWGYCATPLLVDDLVIVIGAAKEAFLVAFDRRDGKIRWQTPGAKPGYGNFIHAEFAGHRQIIGCDNESAGGWDPKTGKRLWKIPDEHPAEFNVPTPLRLGDRVLIAAEQSGARLHAFDNNGCALEKPVATNPDANPSVTSPVETDGVIWFTTDNGIYALDRDLKIIWQLEDAPFKDPAQLIAGNNRVLALTKSGVLALLPSRPDTTTKPQLLTVATDTEVWSQPALVRGRLYLRTDTELLCLALPE